ncbi:serine/threonine-protein kinase [Mycobacteroides abscessus subsp. abscessus]|nr:serine/threonine-protein kinase [Mycobacteroides abscessus subsp. abscessus]
MPEPTYTAVNLPITPPSLTVGVAIDHATGITYIANRDTKQIQRFPVDGPLETLPVTGLGDPYGLQLDAAGRIVVADYGLHRVVRFDPATGIQEVLPFTGLRFPSDVGIDSQGRVLVVSNGRVTRLNSDGQQETLGTTAIPRAHGIALDANDTIFVTAIGGSEVPGLWKFGANGEPTRIAMYNLDGPAGVAVGQDGVVYVANSGQAQYASRVARFMPDGTFLSHIRTWVPLSGNPAVLRPLGLALDAADNITVFGYQPEAIRLIRS